VAIRQEAGASESDDPHGLHDEDTERQVCLGEEQARDCDGRRSPQAEAETSMSCRSQLTKTEKKLERAINDADKHGYTGFVSGRGGLFDYPPFVKAMKKRDALLLQCTHSTPRKRRR
jgi:hypothetical protein